MPFLTGPHSYSLNNPFGKKSIVPVLFGADPPNNSTKSNPPVSEDTLSEDTLAITANTDAFVEQQDADSTTETQTHPLGQIGNRMFQATTSLLGSEIQTGATTTDSDENASRRFLDKNAFNISKISEDKTKANASGNDVNSVTSSSHPGAIAPSDKGGEQAKIAKLIKDLHSSVVTHGQKGGIPPATIQKQLGGNQSYQTNLREVAKGLYEELNKPGLTDDDHKRLHKGVAYILYNSFIKAKPVGLQHTKDDDGGSLTTSRTPSGTPRPTTEVEPAPPSSQSKEDIKAGAIEMTVNALIEGIKVRAKADGIDRRRLEILDTDPKVQQDFWQAAKTLHDNSDSNSLDFEESQLTEEGKRQFEKQQLKQEELWNNTIEDLYEKHVTKAGIKPQTKRATLPTKTDKAKKVPSSKQGVTFDLTPPVKNNGGHLQSEESAAAETSGSTISGEGSVPSSAGQTPLNEQSGTKAANAAKKAQKTEEVKPAAKNTPPAVDDSTKTKSEENQSNENQSVLSGYVGTKIGVGAALLAAGIALKLTLIGIVPGLIMAGAGVAIMAWGAINYMFNNNTEEKKA